MATKKITMNELRNLVRRVISEQVIDSAIEIGGTYTVMMPTDSTGKNKMDVKVKVLGRATNDPTTIVVTPLQDVDYKNTESGQMDRFEKGKHYNTEAINFK